jgi:hypothetical protein
LAGQIPSPPITHPEIRKSCAEDHTDSSAFNLALDPVTHLSWTTAQNYGIKWHNECTADRSAAKDFTKTENEIKRVLNSSSCNFLRDHLTILDVRAHKSMSD